MEQKNFQPEVSAPPPSPVVQEEPTGFPIRLALGVVGGLLGGIIGGLVWGLIMQITEYEVSYVAIGIGFLCGWAVGFFSQKGRGIIFQLIAVGTSILGIFFGKYFGFYLILKDVISEDFGTAAASEISFFSADLFSIFLEALQESASIDSLYDLLFLGLGVYYAWRMLKQDR